MRKLGRRNCKKSRDREKPHNKQGRSSHLPHKSNRICPNCRTDWHKNHNPLKPVAKPTPLLSMVSLKLSVPLTFK